MMDHGIHLSIVSSVIALRTMMACLFDEYTKPFFPALVQISLDSCTLYITALVPHCSILIV
jgi:hypothetical protein